jgi:hypothetical protein
VCVFRHYNIIFSYPQSAPRVPPRVRLPQVGNHWSRRCWSLDVSQPYGASRPVTGTALPFTLLPWSLFSCRGLKLGFDTWLPSLDLTVVSLPSREEFLCSGYRECFLPERKTAGTWIWSGGGGGMSFICWALWTSGLATNRGPPTW